MSTFYYQLYQLTLSSPIAFPELQAIDPLETTDITITFGKINSDEIEDTTHQTPFFKTQENRLWLNTQGIAQFLIEQGNHITVDPKTTADEQSIRLYLLGSCIGAILQQRQQLVLHANAVVIGEQSVVFAGASGNGKSTLAAAFHQKGYRTLTDDVCVINEQQQVIPGYPQIKLWEDSANKLNIMTSELRRIRLQVHKYALPLTGDQFHQEACPVAAVYFLHTHHEEYIKFEQITGTDCLQPLQNHSYRFPFVKGMGLRKPHLVQCSKLVQQANFWHLHRPKHGFQLEKLMLELEQHFKQQGISA